MSDPDCSLVDRQRIRPLVPLARFAVLGLLLLLGKLDHLVFLSQSPIVLLVTDISKTVVSYVVASVDKTLSRS
jgi:uncharacterized membrane protein YecN with MAPEG domain